MMRTKGPVLVLLSLLLAVLWAMPAMAQEQSGSVEGVVKDSSGAVLPGVTVEARSPAVVGVSTAVTDAQGIYRFPALPPGEYELTATIQGFAPKKIAARVALGQLLKVEFVLSVAGVAETVQVTGESPLIDVKQNASFATVDKTLMEKIPKGRDFTTVVSTAPGAQSESYAGGIQIDGASGSENRFIVDGMDTTAIRSGTSNKTVLVDFIQEVQVKSSGYNAEFGGSTGGVISVLGKSGSNALHASGGAYYTGQPMRGAIRPGWRINPYTDVGGNYIGDLEQVKGRDNDSWNNWNPIGDVGGPVIKDKLWFYAGLSHNRNDYSRTVMFTASQPTPGDKKTFETYDWQQYLNWNMSAQLSNNMRLKISGANQWNRSRGSMPGFVSEGSTFQGLGGSKAVLNGQSTSGGWTDSSWYADAATMNNVYNLTGSDYTNQLFSGNLDWVIKPTFFANITAGRLYYNTTQPDNFNTHAIIHSYSNTLSASTSFPAGVTRPPTSYYQSSGWTENPKSSSLSIRAYYARLFANLNTIWYKSLGGQHTFKFGARFERVDNEENEGMQYPTALVRWGGTRTTGDGRRMRGDYGYYRIRQSVTTGAAHSNNWALWAQDSWTIKSNLTINAGIRTERESLPAYTTGGEGINFAFGDKLAPRIGFAYDVQGNNKWKLYGSFGYFFDLMKLSLPIGSFGGDKWKDFYYTLDTYDFTKITCNPVNDALGGTCGPGTFIESVDYRFNSSIPDPSLTPIFGSAHNTIDPNLKPYKTDEYTVGLDHELNATTSLGVRYVHKGLIRAIEDVGTFMPLADGNTIEVYWIANPGFGLASKGQSVEFPNIPTPPAERQYDSVEFRVRKRLAQAWSINASYTYSKLRGNYSGLASSDETGRTDPNVSRYYDAPYMSYNENGCKDPVAGTGCSLVNGPLYTDRPHVIKAQATYDFRFGTSIGLNAIWQSGLKPGATININGYPAFITTRDSFDRTPFYQRYDLYVQHDLKLHGNQRININLNVDNVFDLKTITDWNQTVNRDTLYIDDATFFDGYKWDQLMKSYQAEGNAMRYNPLVVNNWQISPKPYSFMGRRAVRVGFKYSF